MIWNMLGYIGISRQNVKAAITALLKDIKENMPSVSKEIGNLMREIETVRQNWIEILELKDAICEIKKKSLAAFNRWLEITQKKQPGNMHVALFTLGKGTPPH